MKNLTLAFAALINNSATNQQKVIVWAVIAAPLLIAVITFGHNLK